jgi:hypothetical protein
MDITKKFATPEACVHFLEGMRWRSIVVWNCCCPVDYRAAYFRNCAENSCRFPGLAAEAATGFKSKSGWVIP